MATPETNDRIKHFLQRPRDHEWSIQGFGMLRTYLDPAGAHRLHIWDTEQAVESVSTIHDHPWDFTSNIISGSLNNVRYNISDGYDHSAEEFRHARIKCGVGGGIVKGGEGRTWLRTELPENYGPGDYYQQHAEELHESYPNPGCVTIITRFFKEDTEHANVYWEKGEWVTAEPRAATDAEVKRFCDLALERWDVDARV